MSRSRNPGRRWRWRAMRALLSALLAARSAESFVLICSLPAESNFQGRILPYSPLRKSVRKLDSGALDRDRSLVCRPLRQAERTICRQEDRDRRPRAQCAFELQTTAVQTRDGGRDRDTESDLIVRPR